MLDHLTLTKTKFFVLIEMVVAQRSGAMAELTTAIQETFAARKPSRVYPAQPGGCNGTI